MLKIGIAAAIVAAVGTGGALAVRQMQTDEPTTKTTASATAPATVEAAVAQAVARTAPALPPRVTPSIVQRGDMDDGEERRVIPKETITRLGLDTGPSRGPANAPVTIIVFQDLMCKYCTQALGTIDQLFDEYPGKLRLVVKQLPVHKEARLAAEASLAADAQGKFWELHDIMAAHEDDLSRDAIVEYARQGGLDVPKLAAALDRHTYAEALAKEMAAAKEIGVNATPEFLINGEDVQGLRPIEAFRASIDAALAAP
jgi:protein-disulfide isomerase